MWEQLSPSLTLLLVNQVCLNDTNNYKPDSINNIAGRLRAILESIQQRIMGLLRLLLDQIWPKVQNKTKHHVLLTTLTLTP